MLQRPSLLDVAILVTALSMSGRSPSFEQRVRELPCFAALSFANEEATRRRRGIGIKKCCQLSLRKWPTRRTNQILKLFEQEICRVPIGFSLGTTTSRPN